MRTSAFPVVALVFGLGCSTSSSDDATSSVASKLTFPTAGALIRYDRDAIFQDRVEIRATVRNLGYRKVVGARVSIDKGPFYDVEGSYSGAAGGKNETWLVTLRPQAGWQRLEYALYYRDLENDNAIYWDNNEGKNHALSSSAVVHRIGDMIAWNTLLIDLEVKNIAYDKNCQAGVTANGWLGSSYAAAHYVGPGDRPGFERWRVEATLEPRGTRSSLGMDAAAYEYAVACQIDGVAHWDNHDGSNYRRERVAPPALAWEIPFQGGEKAAVAPDGRTFVVSHQRWISAYSADGQWLFATDAGGYVGEMFWSEQAGLVFNADGAWKALSPNGALRWALEADYTILAAHTGDGDYLVGPRGGAVITADMPIFYGPEGGCETGNNANENAPTVSARGRLFCRSAGVIVHYDLRTGKAGAPLPLEGFPFAATESAFVLIAPDRTWLRAYSLLGAPLWQKPALSVASDTQYGYGQACPTHAFGGLAVFRNQGTVNTGAGIEYIGVDVDTGLERFRKASPSYGYNACAAADGRFYASESPYKYGWSVDRIDENGAIQSMMVGAGSTIVGVSRDGAVALREWPYYPNDRGRLLVRDRSGSEIFSRTYASTESTAYSLAIANGMLVLVEPGKVSQLRFE